MAIVGNNSHLYAKQEIPEIEAKKFANENYAIFTLVSSKCNEGINDLFVYIGKKFLRDDLSMDPNIIKHKENMEMILNKKLNKYIDY